MASTYEKDLVDELYSSLRSRLKSKAKRKAQFIETARAHMSGLEAIKKVVTNARDAGTTVEEMQKSRDLRKYLEVFLAADKLLDDRSPGRKGFDEIVSKNGEYQLATRKLGRMLSLLKLGIVDTHGDIQTSLKNIYFTLHTEPLTDSALQSMHAGDSKAREEAIYSSFFKFQNKTRASTIENFLGRFLPLVQADDVFKNLDLTASDQSITTVLAEISAGTLPVEATARRAAITTLLGGPSLSTSPAETKFNQMRSNPIQISTFLNNLSAIKPDLKGNLDGFISASTSYDGIKQYLMDNYGLTEVQIEEAMT